MHYYRDHCGLSRHLFCVPFFLLHQNLIDFQPCILLPVAGLFANALLGAVSENNDLGSQEMAFHGGFDARALHMRGSDSDDIAINQQKDFIELDRLPDLTQGDHFDGGAFDALHCLPPFSTIAYFILILNLHFTFTRGNRRRLEVGYTHTRPSKTNSRGSHRLYKGRLSASQRLKFLKFPNFPTALLSQPPADSTEFGSGHAANRSRHSLQVCMRSESRESCGRYTYVTCTNESRSS